MTTKQKLSNLTAITSVTSTDLLYIVQSSDSRKITVDNLFAYSNARILANVTGIANVTVPAAANSAGTAGAVRYDSDYIYVCVSANTWKRANLVTW